MSYQLQTFPLGVAGNMLNPTRVIAPPERRIGGFPLRLTERVSYSKYQGLPTSNPNEWVAKIGSPAHGKMDMYTVLLHEYGYALGLDHSSHSQVPPEADLANSISAFHY